MRSSKCFFYGCLGLFLFLSSCISRQRIEQPVSVVKSYPQYPGGEEEWKKFIKDNLTYPANLLESDEVGSVNLFCHIGKDGLLKDIYSPNHKNEFDKEVERVLYTMPPFIFPMEGQPDDAFFKMSFYFGIEKDGEKINSFFLVENIPEYPGGESELCKYIRNTIKYSFWDRLRSSNKKGEVVVQFVIAADGTLTGQPEIIKSLSSKYDKAILKMFQNMPKWKPGKHRGPSGRTLCRLTFTFEIKGLKKYVHINDLQQFWLYYEHRYSLPDTFLKDIFEKGKLTTFDSIYLIESK